MHRSCATYRVDEAGDGGALHAGVEVVGKFAAAVVLAHILQGRKGTARTQRMLFPMRADNARRNGRLTVTSKLASFWASSKRG